MQRNYYLIFEVSLGHCTIDYSLPPKHIQYLNFKIMKWGQCGGTLSLVALFPTHLCADTAERAAGDGPGIWDLTTQVGNQNGVTGSWHWSGLVWLLQLFRQSAIIWELCVRLYVALPFKNKTLQKLLQHSLFLKICMFP